MIDFILFIMIAIVGVLLGRFIYCAERNTREVVKALNALSKETGSSVIVVDEDKENE